MCKRYKILFGVLLLAVLLLSGCAGGKSGEIVENSSGPEAASEAPAEKELPPETAPSTGKITFVGTDMEGNAVSSDILSQSKLTMINVWATYCGPCLSEMPELGELAAEYEREEFQLIGIVSDVLEGEDQSLAESLIEQTGAGYTHLLLNESIYYALLTDVNAVPTTYFISGDGTILDTVVGAREKSAWEELIDGLLEKV